MDLIRYQHDLEFQKTHMKTLQNIKPLVNTSSPSTLQLKHLNARAKKRQMTEDRNFEIALENRKLMVKMTEVKYYCLWTIYFRILASLIASSLIASFERFKILILFIILCQKNS